MPQKKRKNKYWINHLNILSVWSTTGYSQTSAWKFPNIYLFGNSQRLNIPILDWDFVFCSGFCIREIKPRAPSSNYHQSNVSSVNGHLFQLSALAGGPHTSSLYLRVLVIFSESCRERKKLENLALPPTDSPLGRSLLHLATHSTFKERNLSKILHMDTLVNNSHEPE